MTNNPAVEVAKERRAESEEAGVVTLSTGIRARLLPVSASLIDAVRARVPVPKVPLWHNPNSDRDEENPNDPAYTRALEEYEQARGEATIDALVMFGVELIDPLPADFGWVKKLKRLGIEVDTGDPDELEFVYKKYIAAGAKADIQRIVSVTGQTAEAVERAAGIFQR